MRDVFGRLVGGGNINNVQGIGALNSKEKVEALLSGFNRGSGDPLFGLGGTSMEIDPKTGNITENTRVSSRRLFDKHDSWQVFRSSKLSCSA